MTSLRFAVGLSVSNMVLLIVLLAQLRPVAAQDVAPVLRGRKLEIVDAQGRARATLHVEPAGKSASQPYPETVIFRLITERGRPAVKITTSEQGSGLSVVAGTGTNNTYASLGAMGTTTLLKLKNEDGRERLTKP